MKKIVLHVSDRAYKAVKQALDVRDIVGQGYTIADAAQAKVWEALRDDQPEVLIALREEGSAVGTKKAIDGA